ncbi:MAG: phosphodiester glycosidase family protein [Gemmatimonadaceae bacterium]
MKCSIFELQMLFIAAIVLAPPVFAQRRDTTAARELVPGVSYRQFTDPRGPWAMNLVRVNLRRRGIEIRNARALDHLKGRERVTDMVRREEATGIRVLAAVNGDFFELKSGENENNQVIAGEWWKGLKVTDSPYDTYDNVHAQFGIDAARRPLIDRFVLDGKAWDRGVMTPIITLNFNPSGNPEGTALYTARYGPAAPRDTARQTAEATLLRAGKHGDTLVFVRRGAISASSGSVIPTDGAVLAAYGTGLRTKEVQSMADGDTIEVLLATLPHIDHGQTPAMLIGGWPQILRDGKNVAADAATVEGTISRNAEMRHPRTAVGYSRDGSTLFLLTVDGRSESSGGMTLVELANMMRKLGAWQAMNFDGGGSTTMVIDGALVNKPSDKEGERAVGNALLVVKTR